MQRLPDVLLEGLEGADHQPQGNHMPGLNDDILSQYDKLIHARDEKTEEPTPTYVLTLEDSDYWTHGNPTGISTRIGDHTTETLLFFTRTTYIWRADLASFITNSDTPYTTLPPATILTTVTVTGSDGESTTTAEISEFSTTAAVSTTLDTFLTEIISSTTNASGTDTATESAAAGDGSDLSQAAVIGISVGISVFSFVVFLGTMVWYLRRRRREKAASALPDAPVDRSWEPKYDGMQHGQASQTPTVNSNVFPIPDLAPQGHQSVDYGRDQQPAVYQQVQQQAMTPQSMTPPPVSPYQQQAPQQPMGPYQQPAQQHMDSYHQQGPQQLPQQMPQQMDHYNQQMAQQTAQQMSQHAQQIPQQAQQPVYNAYRPSMGAVSPQNFAVELPSENYRR